MMSTVKADVPKDYICFLCKSRGDHWIMDCQYQQFSLVSVDHTIFLQDTQSSIDLHDIKSCLPIQRLLTALKFYDHHTDKNKEIFCHFMQTVYETHVFDDYFHLIKYHQNDIESIKDEYQLNKCELQSSNPCLYTNRHFQTDDILQEDIENDDDSKYSNLYIETMDSLHFYLMHLHDCSLRPSANFSVVPNDQPQYFDSKLYEMGHQIRNSKEFTGEFPRFSAAKFNISVGQSVSEPPPDDEDDTFLDYVHRYLSSYFQFSKAVMRLKEMIFDEEYCTESMDIELEMYLQDGNSNISNIIGNGQVLDEMVKIFEISKGDSRSFKIGIPWYYFPKYGNDEDEEYDHHEFIVHAKYQNLKEEIKNYKYLKYIDQYKHKILPKAKQHIMTNIAKSMRSTRRFGGIKYNDPLDINNLICLIMYCDYTELSADFTESFRKIHEFELLTQIKNRNAEYYHFSKILQQTITCYGQCNLSDQSGNGLLPPLKGPFYSGMCCILNIPQFHIYLLSPTSTSVHLEVAMRFGGDDGMILEFDNHLGLGRGLNGMDCAWISRYKEEAECLFFGDKGHPIRITSIRIIETNTNYAEIISAIALLDDIISNSLWNQPTSQELINSKPILMHLLYDTNKTKLNPYIYSCWKSFVSNKQEISIDLWKLNEYIVDSDFLELIFENGFRTMEFDVDTFDGDYVFHNDGTNLLRKEFLDVFINVKSIWIDYAQNSDKYWSFSLLRLLYVIQDTNIERIEINSCNDGKMTRSWLSCVWSQLSSQIIQQYNDRHFSVAFRSSTDQKDHVDIILNRVL